MQHRKMSVLHFHSKQRYAKPVILIPALISRSYVLDLYPGGSLIEFLRAAGYDVFLLDWGIPGDEDATLSLQEIVTSYIASAVARIRSEASLGGPVSIVGYCMGGTLAVLHAASAGLLHGDNLVTLASPVDFSQGGTLARWCQRDYLDIDKITAVFGNVPAHLVETVFTLLRPTAKFRAALAFSAHSSDRSTRIAFEAMDRWVNDWVPFPGAAAKEWIGWLYQDNLLIRNQLRMGDKLLKLDAIAAPLLCVAAPGDVIVPAASSRALMTAVSSSDKTYREVSGGHIGMVAGRNAQRNLWTSMHEWLAPRSA
ncbi:MAG: alpha/beta fold hydrolase [Candidatus Eremiobacteraeota bacterium]|nr:alpha/beta fold hydrolase [Candidatus Eremiobacteraeota bacterium]